MGRFARSWSLFRASWSVMRKDPEMMVFPVLSGLACLLLLASFAVPVIVAGREQWQAHSERVNVQIGGGLLVLYYFGAHFIMTFFNVALVACAVKRLEGGDPTVGYGIGEAADRIGIIAGWSLFSASVGLVLRALEERADFLGKIVISLVGVLWTLAAFFVVPILVVERKGPFAAIKESSALLKRTWGEQIIAGTGFGMISFLFMIPCLLLLVLAVVAGVQGAGPWVVVNLVAGGILGLVAVSVVTATLQSIFQTALYLYARDGQVRGPFAEEALRGAMVPKGA
jgi:hypothetical protein